MNRLLTLLFTIVSFSFFSQDTIPDTLKTPHPYKKAMLYSACLPGAGQVYNSIHSELRPKKAYWKVPLIYTALGTAGYSLVSNQLTQLSLKTEYSDRLNNSTNLNPKWEAYDDQAVLFLYRQYLDWRDLSILGVAAVYFIQIVDAGVEAHFLKFDVSDNLSMKIEPTLMNYKSPGISLKMTFR
jgi:hypothetical protein